MWIPHVDKRVHCGDICLYRSTGSQMHVKTTLKSQGLLHLIDEKFVPSKQDLDKLQQNWLYKIFQDTLKTPGTKSVVKAHLGDMDTCKIWADKKGENVVVK